QGFFYIRASSQQGLYLFRIYVLSILGNDDILLPSCYMEKPVFIKVSQVTCVKPAIPYALPGSFFVLVIPQHDRRSFYLDLADPIPVRIVDLHFQVGQGKPGGNILIVNVTV